MGTFVICTFRPKLGMDGDLLAVLKDHMPTLRSQDLITERPAYVMKANDGTIVEVFEWKSAKHAEDAHSNPVVLELWKRFGACCDYITLSDLAESKGPFPHFEPIDFD